MVSRPLLYITANLQKYWAIWFAASYSSLLDIFLPLLSCRVSSYCTHPLNFRPVSSPSRNVLFNFSEKRVPQTHALRFLMWIMITKGHLGFHPFYLDAVYAVSLSNRIRCLPADPCVSADCKILVCFCESLFRIEGIHSRSFDNLRLFFNRLRGPRP